MASEKGQIPSPSNAESGGPRMVACQWKGSSPTGPALQGRIMCHTCIWLKLEMGLTLFRGDLVVCCFAVFLHFDSCSINLHWAGGSFIMSFSSLLILFWAIFPSLLLTSHQSVLKFLSLNCENLKMWDWENFVEKILFPHPVEPLYLTYSEKQLIFFFFMCTSRRGHI